MQRLPFRLRLTCLFASSLLLWLTGCNTESGNVLGDAYVAPATLNLRHDLAQKTGTVTVMTHGEHVSIIDVRRRFVRIRTDKGMVGWVDSAQLLSSSQMDQIRRDKQVALALPSEGAATVFEALNVHLEPSRQSPAFTRIAEAGSVTVLAHRLEPKATGPAAPTSFALLKPQASSRRQRKEKQAKSQPQRPPKPLPPKPPSNWQELSAERIDGAETTADLKSNQEKLKQAKKQEDAKKPVVLEDWTLVRTKDKQCGWVLSRNLNMSIPDEVAQYAEGKHITSYFDLGTVVDEQKGQKHNWLWTTASSQIAYDFDGWRVFLWNRHHHRYETSYRQRDVEGYFPVHVDPADATVLGRTFELITKDEDTKMRRRTYVFDGTRVHLTGAEDYSAGQAARDNKANGLDISGLQSKLPQPGWFRRQWNGLLRRFKSK